MTLILRWDTAWAIGTILTAGQIGPRSFSGRYTKPTGGIPTVILPLKRISFASLSIRPRASVSHQKYSIGHQQPAILPEAPKQRIVNHINNRSAAHILHAKSECIFQFLFGLKAYKSTGMCIFS